MFGTTREIRCVEVDGLASLSSLQESRGHTSYNGTAFSKALKTRTHCVEDATILGFLFNSHVSGIKSRSGVF